MILYLCFPKFQLNFMLNLVAETLEKLGLSCWIISATKTFEHY